MRKARNTLRNLQGMTVDIGVSGGIGSGGGAAISGEHDNVSSKHDISFKDNKDKDDDGDDDDDDDDGDDYGSDDEDVEIIHTNCIADGQVETTGLEVCDGVDDEADDEEDNGGEFDSDSSLESGGSCYSIAFA